ncbi:hypothetical protein BpHYR1_022175 [Brachionus plicatilis]|uniref:Uncharacterized protein n=1 Tax=Brachionus plicatilis TaxID=10195 RepID=A0A3M7QF04_BRAPC|nr:hypothetical protein BpHYR1_022175 [Brachionus plicatilis]
MELKKSNLSQKINSSVAFFEEKSKKKNNFKIKQKTSLLKKKYKCTHTEKCENLIADYVQKLDLGKTLNVKRELNSLNFFSALN